MPLLLHHWKEIVQLWLSVLASADDEALKALLECVLLRTTSVRPLTHCNDSVLQKLVHDIRTTLSPSYEEILSHLVALLPQRISADAITALLASFSALFKHVLIPSGDLQLAERTWAYFKNILPKCNSEVQRATAEVWGTTLRKIKSASRAALVQLLVTDLNGIEDMSAWTFVFACKVCAQASLVIACLDILLAIVCRTEPSYCHPIDFWIVIELSLDLREWGSDLHPYSSSVNSSYAPCQVCRTIFARCRSHY
jgi:U3 small nucleolar RNA-associated protein 20